MSHIYILLITSAILWYVVDISGVTEYIRRIGSLNDPKFDKPLFCSRCLIFWLSVVMSIIYWSIAVLAFGCILSFIAPILTKILKLIENALDNKL